MNNNLFKKVFTYLALGLLISFVVAYFTSINSNMIFNIFGKYFAWLVIIELGTAFVLTLFIKKMPPMAVKVLYILYCIISGFTLSSIFILYEMTSVITVFAVTCLIFGALAVYGYKTEKDITKLGTILMFSLIGVILLSIVNIFIGSNMMEIGISAISALVFTLYIAYDIKVVKVLQGTMEEDNLAVYGAFQLYLDFINLLIDLLRIFGGGKKD